MAKRNDRVESKRNFINRTCKMKKEIIKTYCEQRLSDYNISKEANKFRIIHRDYPPRDIKFFDSDADDNIVITYLTPTGSICEYPKGKKLIQFTRTRLKAGINGNKYSQPANSGTFPFMTPGVVNKCSNKTKIKTLYIIEGEFKAFVASNYLDIDIIGIGGIHNYKDKSKNELDEYIQVIIRNCQVENIVLIFDADCKKIEYSENKDLHQRLHSFAKSILNFKELCTPLEITLYFSHIRSEFEGTAKGLDDLIILKKDNCKEIKNELLQFTSGKNKKYFDFIELSSIAANKIYEYFYIDKPENFYEQYKDIIQNKEFTYRNKKYYYNGEKLVVSWHGEAANYMRVGTTYYKRILEKNAHNELTERIDVWSIGEIQRDYNNDREFVKQIKKYDTFTNIPDNTSEYKRVHTVEHDGIKSDLYNRYYPVTWIPEQGKWKTIEMFLKHIFNCNNLKGENLYEFGLDYLQLLFYYPKKRLPVLCFVSKQRNTGKSTFLRFLRLIFGENIAILDNDRFSSKFTAHFIDKLIIAIDETFIEAEKKIIQERIKRLSTEPNQWLEAKGQNPVQINTFSKLIFCSNNEKNFMSIDEEENRYAIIRVNTLNEDIPDILEKMKPEIPGFLHFLKNRKLKYETNKTRMSFDFSVFETEFGTQVKEASKSRLEKEIKEFISEIFMLHDEETTQLTLSDIHEGINKNVQFKYAKTLVKECLNDNFNLKASTDPKRYKKYHNDFNESLTESGKIECSNTEKVGKVYTFNRENFK